MKTHKYNGYHFRPVRKFTQQEIDMTLQAISRYLESDLDRRAVFSRYDGGTYSHAAFYAAMDNDPADIFYCEETGKNYLPCGAELFIYKN